MPPEDVRASPVVRSIDEQRMTERGSVLELARAAESALDRNRPRIDDLNVYPGARRRHRDEHALTVRAVREALEAGTTATSPTRAPALGARGNSGVILSQIIRGAAEVLRRKTARSRPRCAALRRRGLGTARPRAGRGDDADRDPRDRDEAESRRDDELPELLHALVERGDEAVARTQEQLDVLRAAGVVDAGAAGLVEILRGIAAVRRRRAAPGAGSRRCR